MKSEGSSLFPRQLVRGLIAFMLVLMGLVHSMTNAGAQASDGDERTNASVGAYTGENFAWSLEWDEDTWELADAASEGGEDSLNLSSLETHMDASFLATEQYDGDPLDCVASFEEDFLSDPAISNVREYDADPPSSLRRAGNAVFSYIVVEDQREVIFFNYVVCQTLVEDEAVLIAWMTIQEGAFDRDVEGFYALVSAVEIGGTGRAGADEETGEDETNRSDDDPDGSSEDTDPSEDAVEDVADATFTGTFFQWTVEWDEDVWTVGDMSDVEGADFVQLASVEGQPIAFANILAVSDYGGDPATCVENFVDDILANDAVSNIAEATGVDLPRAPRGWQNAAYSYTATGESGPFDLIDYVECRTLVEDEAVLVAWVTTVEDDFDGAVVNFGDLLDSIEIGDASGTTHTSDRRDRNLAWLPAELA